VKYMTMRINWMTKQMSWTISAGVTLKSSMKVKVKVKVESKDIDSHYSSEWITI
jgi:hypothetical protein